MTLLEQMERDRAIREKLGCSPTCGAVGEVTHETGCPNKVFAGPGIVRWIYDELACGQVHRREHHDAHTWTVQPEDDSPRTERVNCPGYKYVPQGIMSDGDDGEYD